MLKFKTHFSKKIIKFDTYKYLNLKEKILMIKFDLNSDLFNYL